MATKNNPLINKLITLYCDNFVTYYKSHGYHFNVIGSTFSQDHALLEEVYNFLWEQHDILGEQIRQLDAATPTSLKTILSEANVEECSKVRESSATMFGELVSDFDTLILEAQVLYDESDMESCGGMATMLGDYLKALSKLHWKLKATLGKGLK